MVVSEHMNASTLRKRGIAVGVGATALGLLLFATELPSALMQGGGSKALAELLARSPGARVGGVALKAKKPRMAKAARDGVASYTWDAYYENAANAVEKLVEKVRSERER